MSDVSHAIVQLRVKPNAFLYAFESSRLYLVLMLVVALVMMPIAHFKTGTPIGSLMLQIALAVYGATSFIFFILAVIVALCTEFVVTNKRVVVQRVMIRRISEKISIPIKLITAIEVRPYGARYGSVYLDCDEASLLSDSQTYDGSSSQVSDPFHSASFNRVSRSRPLNVLIVRTGRAKAWLSLPSSSPPLSGFYGFKHFETFAKLVLGLR